MGKRKMTCFNPRFANYAYMSLNRQKSFKKPDGTKVYYNTGEKYIGKKIHFIKKKDFDPNAIGNGNIIIPCGKCIGCRLDKAKEWGLRGLLESKQWKNNCFITLTYDPKYLPKDKNLHKEDIQKFLKRLRKHEKGIQPREWKGKIEYPIRYFYSGEYGPQFLRPH